MQNPKGKRTNTGRTHFKKGHIPWIKGRKLPYKPRLKAIGREAWNKGKKMSDISCQKMRIAKLGIILSEEHKKKISNSLIGNKYSLGIKASAETRRRMSEAKKGEKSYSWKGGITPWHRAIRRSLEYRLWREAVYKRDNFTCQECGDDTSGNLNAHHIKPFSLFPELRFAIDNGITLCVECHKKTDTFGRMSQENKQRQICQKLQ